MRHKVLFLQQNVARRHEPTAALNHLIDLLTPFSYLRRDLSYLNGLGVELNAYTGLYKTIYELQTDGVLPRILPVVLLQEPNVSRGKITGFPNKTVFAIGENPRAAIVTLANANVNCLTHLSSSDHTVMQINTEGQKIIITSFYHDITYSEHGLPLSEISSLSSNTLYAGDTNAHSVLWGSSSNNPRGDKWEETILANNLSILNEGDSPTFENHIGRTHVDVSLSSKPEFYHNWTNTRTFCGSDHALICFTYSCNNLFTDRMVRNLANVNWAKFEESLNVLNQDKITTTIDLEREATKLIKNVQYAFNEACPLRKAYPGKPCKWWCRDLSNILRKKNIAAKVMRKYQGTQKGVRANLRKLGLGKLFRKKMQERKEETWANFISGLKSPKNISNLLRSLKEPKQGGCPS